MMKREKITLWRKFRKAMMKIKKKRRNMSKN